MIMMKKQNVTFILVIKSLIIVLIASSAELLDSASSSQLDNCSSSKDPLIVKTSKGCVRGMHINAPSGKVVDAFLGIKYAKPPIGIYRFRHPSPVDAWTGIYNATSFSNTCVQINDTFFGDFKGSKIWNPSGPKDEDCLSLNIWVPRPRPQNAPVFVWIFGGGFYSGSASLDIYNGATFAAEENVIVVSINYRVASLGFFFFDREDAPGNAGLFDQLMALQWVKNNIIAFGGNQENIVLFGESSGAVSIGFHLISPLSRNLFNKAILQSGSMTCQWSILDKSEAFGRSLKLAQKVGCPIDLSHLDATLLCMQNVPASKLVNSENEDYGVVGFPFVAIIDGAFLDEDPVVSLHTNNFKQTEILVGSNKDEGTYFLVYHMPRLFNLTERALIDYKQFERAVKHLYPCLANIGYDAILFEYTNWLDSDDYNHNLNAIDKIVGDHYFTCDVNEVAYRYAFAGNKVWSYYFTHRSSQSPWPSWMGVIHGDEINFVFGDPLDLKKDYTQSEVNLSKRIMRYWANFARSG